MVEAASAREARSIDRRRGRSGRADNYGVFSAAEHPVLAFLAKSYVTCVQWHSSVPGATWPNRNFAHAATSDESTDIEVGFYRDRTIFELLDREQEKLNGDDKKRTPWRIFFHDTPQVIAFRRLWRRDRWHLWHSAEGLWVRLTRGGSRPTRSSNRDTTLRTAP